MNTERAGKLQLPKLFSYSAAAVLGLLILLGIFSWNFLGQFRSIALIVPLPLGVILGVFLYYRFSHEVVRYDETGFTLSKGTRVSESYEWNQFRQVSLSADSKGGANVRLYFQPDGEYVDIPASRTGIDPFSLRNSLISKLSKT